MAKLVRYSCSDTWAACAAEHIASRLEQACGKRGKAVLIAAGGTTPAKVYSELAKQNLDWGRVTVTLSDERWVAETSSRSNLAMLKASLGTDAALRANILSVHSPGITAAQGAARLGRRFAELQPADVCVLGMGADMHTASLFPGMKRLAIALNENAPNAMVVQMPATGETRITLTRPALQSATHILLLTTGEAKRVALDRAIAAGSPETAPVSLFLDRATVHHCE